MNLDYPFSPRAEWRLAVSRRFNLPVVDFIYASIQPVLEKEGLLMECAYASESTDDDDFWMNRLDLILELADLHILLDIEKSPNMEFEFERSARISKARQPAALSRNFGWNPITSRALIRPITIVISQGRKRDRLVARHRKASLYFADPNNIGDLARRLENAIRWAKRNRLTRLKKMKDFMDRRVRFMGILAEDLEFSLVKMTELATRIKEGQGIDDLLPTAEEIEVRERTTRQRVNDQFEWSVRLKKGDLEIPPRFIDTYVMIRDHSRENLAALTTPEMANNWFLRGWISLGSFLKTVKLRRRKGSAPNSMDLTCADTAAQSGPEADESQTELSCSFCGRLRTEVPVLMERAPLYICSYCVISYLQTLDESSLPKEEVGSCGFCNNSHDDISRIVEHQGARICNVCLILCREVIAEELEAEP